MVCVYVSCWCLTCGVRVLGFELVLGYSVSCRCVVFDVRCYIVYYIIYYTIILYNPLLLFHSFLSFPLPHLFFFPFPSPPLLLIYSLPLSSSSSSPLPLQSSHPFSSLSSQSSISPQFILYVSALGYPYLCSEVIPGQSDPACFIGVDG